MLRKIIGTIICAISSLFIFAALGDIISGDTKTPLGVLIGMLVFFLIIDYGGLMLIIKSGRRQGKKDYQVIERQVLGIIRKYKGKVTPLEIASDTDFTIAEAEKFLGDMVERGIGEKQLTENGNFVYVFNGFISEEEKKTARDVLDW